MSFKPRRYQQEAIRHLLARPHGGLFMDPGTGKTACVLAAFHALKRRGLVDKLLVFAPLRVCYSVWPAELEKWGFPYSCHILHGKGLKTFVPADADIYITNYDSIPELASKPAWFKTNGWRWMAVFDESTYIKRASTQRFRALKTLLSLFSRRCILTGTPIPNGFLDLFGQVYAADLGEALGRYITQYRRSYFYPTGYGGYTWALQPGGEARILERLDGYFYRVKAEDVLDLPPKHDVEVWLDLPAKVKAQYEELEREFVLDLQAGRVHAKNAGVLSAKLRQFCGGAVFDRGGLARWVHEVKLEALGELVASLQGNPLLVGYEFTPHGEAIAARLGAPLVNGQTPPRESDRLFQEFNAGKHAALVAQAGCVAHGINLQAACHHVAWYGLPWDLEDYVQFTRRVYRSGQTRTVFNHHLLFNNTVDWLMNRVVRGSKAPRQDGFLKAFQERYL